MNLLVELVATAAGEALGSALQGHFDPFTRILSLWIVLAIWALTPLVEWGAYRFSSSRDTLWSLYLAILIALAWPTFALLCSIALFHKKRDRYRVSA
mgnify:CR=1 FL=1